MQVNFPISMDNSPYFDGLYFTFASSVLELTTGDNKKYTGASLQRCMSLYKILEEEQPIQYLATAWPAALQSRRPGCIPPTLPGAPRRSSRSGGVWPVPRSQNILSG